MPMKIGESLPTFEVATEWLNEPPTSIEDYVKNQPTLVHFWATSCGTCKTNLPQLQELQAKYQALNLTRTNFQAL